MESRTEQEELIERALDVLPRFKRSMLRHVGGPPERGGRRGGPHRGHGRGRGRKGLKERMKGRWGGPGSPAQMRIAMQLYRSGPAKVGDIAHWIGVSAPTASEQIDGLVEAGMAERTVNPDDRREVLVELTPKAIELADYFWNLQRSRVEKVFERFSPEEQPLVVRTLEAFAEVFEEDHTEFIDCKQEADA